LSGEFKFKLNQVDLRKWQDFVHSFKKSRLKSYLSPL